MMRFSVQGSLSDHGDHCDGEDDYCQPEGPHVSSEGDWAVTEVSLMSPEPPHLKPSRNLRSCWGRRRRDGRVESGAMRNH